MALLRRLSLLCLLAALLVGLPACQSGQNMDDEEAPRSNWGEEVGGFFSGIGRGFVGLFQKHPPKNPTRVQVLRYVLADPFAKQAPTTQPVARAEQHLVIDLNTGRATISDLQGKVYPFDLSAPKLAEIQQGIRELEWVGKHNPPKGAKDVAYYQIEVFENTSPYKKTGQWTAPGKSQPAGLAALLIEEFGQAQRLIQPLSKDINLIK